MKVLRQFQVLDVDKLTLDDSVSLLDQAQVKIHVFSILERQYIR